MQIIEDGLTKTGEYGGYWDSSGGGWSSFGSMGEAFDAAGVILDMSNGWSYTEAGTKEGSEYNFASAMGYLKGLIENELPGLILI